MSPAAVIESFLEPVSESLNVAAARKLLEVRADEQAAARMQELAAKANEGALSPSERSEYEALVAVGDVVAILQAHARLRLQQS